MVPAVGPGSGTAPGAWPEPEATKRGRLAGAIDPAKEPVKFPLRVVALSVVTLMVPAVKAEGVNWYGVPRRLKLRKLVWGE